MGTMALLPVPDEVDNDCTLCGRNLSNVWKRTSTLVEEPFLRSGRAARLSGGVAFSPEGAGPSMARPAATPRHQKNERGGEEPRPFLLHPLPRTQTVTLRDADCPDVHRDVATGLDEF